MLCDLQQQAHPHELISPKATLRPSWRVANERYTRPSGSWEHLFLPALSQKATRSNGTGQNQTVLEIITHLWPWIGFRLPHWL